MPSHRSGHPAPSAPRAHGGKRRAAPTSRRRDAHAARLAGRVRGSRAGRAAVAATSTLAVVAASAVIVAAAVIDPAVADGGRPSTALTEVRDTVSGLATPGALAAATTATVVPAHADLAANAGAAQPAPTPAARRTAKARFGIDVSWPQCGTVLPTIRLDFAVIGLTDGHAESVSPCFAEQVAWAKANRLRVAVYVVPNSPGSNATAAMRLAAPTPCVAVDASCPAYAAGVRQAQHALAAAAAAQLPSTGWWLDVEESRAGTLWGDDLVANAAVLKGWVDTLRAAHLPVGAYSTHGYWTMITGGWDANLPQWVPVGTDGITDAQLACGQPFTSGPVVMTQWLTGPYDGNLLCPTTDADPMARAFTGTGWAQPTTAGVPALLTTPVPHPELEQPTDPADPAAGECDTPATDPKKNRASEAKPDPKSDPACADADPPKAKDGKNPKNPKAPKTPKAKGHGKPGTASTSHPKAKPHHTTSHGKPKGKHKRG